MGPRVVCLVPSWTETLIECGINVVGRTRYCLYPESAKDLLPVGGTKDISWAKVKSLHPDLLILDREENPKKMADESDYPWLASHIKEIADIPRFLRELSHHSAFSTGECEHLRKNLRRMGDRWEAVLHFDSTSLIWGESSLAQAPGVEKVISQRTRQDNEKPNWQRLTPVYVIWKKPWMVVSAETFIGSMLEGAGYARTQSFEKPYPQVELSDFNPDQHLFLFSSEPYDFAREVPELAQLNLNAALVNGESFSWFGVRALRFLEGLYKIPIGPSL